MSAVKHQTRLSPLARFTRRQPGKPSPLVATLSYLVLLIWALVVIFPLYWVVVTSLKSPIDVSSGPKFLPWIDFHPTLSAWRYILVQEGADMIRPFMNSLTVSISSSLLALLIGSMAGYALARIEFKPKLESVILFIICAVGTGIAAVSGGVPFPVTIAVGLGVFLVAYRTFHKHFRLRLGNHDIALWIISQRALPPVGIVIPLYMMYLHLHLLKTLVPLILTYAVVNLPIVVWLSRDFFTKIPYAIEDSAIIDGASRYRIFRSIMLPAAKSGLAATLLFILVLSWNEYLLALVLSTADTQTMPLLVAAQNNTRGPQWWTMSALIVVMIIPVFIMALLLERFLKRGVLSGALKG